MPYAQITRESRHPFETCVLIAGMVGGWSALLGDLWPSSMEQMLPAWTQITWGMFLGIGALVALAGAADRNRPRGILIEQIGLMSFGVSCFLYGTVLLVASPSSGFVSGTLFVLVGIASIIQWWRLEKFIRRSIAQGERIRGWRNAD